MDNSIRWRALPGDFPPYFTVFNYFVVLERIGASTRVLDALQGRIRLADGQATNPTAAVIDSASVRATVTVGTGTSGLDAVKKFSGGKCHIILDTLGLLLAAVVTGAGLQDRDGAKSLLESLADSCHRAQLVWADGGYAGKLVIWAGDRLGRPCGSSSAATYQASRCYSGAGVSNALWPGSLPIAGACATTNDSRPTTKPWCAGR